MVILRVLLSFFFVLGAVKVQAYPGDLTLEEVSDEIAAPGTKPGEKPSEEQKSAQEKALEQQAKAEGPEKSYSEKMAEEKAKADAVKKSSDNYERTLCHSTKEYVETLKFLRATRVIIVTENTARMIADRVSRACDGATERFSKILALLKGVGLSDRKSVEMALDFSSRPLDVQKNFLEIFTKSFLTEFFDHDYAMAVALAYELSKDYKGDPAQVREDFLELVRFCKDDKKLDLPTRLCAEYTIKLARLTQFHPKGVRASFYKLYERLRDDRTFAMDIRGALELSYNILKFGPRATDNFFIGYDFAVAKDGLDMSHASAVEFGLRMAGRSYLGVEPPLVPNPNEPPPAVMIRAPATTTR